MFVFGRHAAVRIKALVPIHWTAVVAADVAGSSWLTGSDAVEPVPNRRRQIADRHLKKGWLRPQKRVVEMPKTPHREPSFSSIVLGPRYRGVGLTMIPSGRNRRARPPGSCRCDPARDAGDGNLVAVWTATRSGFFAPTRLPRRCAPGNDRSENRRTLMGAPERVDD